MLVLILSKFIIYKNQQSPRLFVPDETHIFEGKNNLYFYVPKRDWRELRIVYYRSKEHYNELIGM